MVRTLILISVLALLTACSSVNQSTSSQALNQSNPAVHTLMAKAETAEQRGEWQTALTYMDQARRIEPRNPYLLYRQANAYTKKGDYDIAYALIGRARVLAMEDQGLLKQLKKLESEIYLRKGEAIEF